MKNKQVSFSKNKQELEKIIEKIINKKIHCYFISPHFDDAALSAGALISYLVNKVPVTVVNVFTKGDREPYTLATRLFLSRCGYKDADNLFFDRMKEDKKIFKKLGVEVINLGFIDAFYRKKADISLVSRWLGRLIPELVHIYPNYRFYKYPTKISNLDSKLENEIEKKLRDLIKTKNTVVFCPVGVGKYVDHIIVRKLCSKNFNNLIYWSDFNYSMMHSGEIKFINNNNLGLDYFNKNLFSKKILIEGYKTQKYAISTHGMITIFPDFYYF